ncbi:hypothetical protein BT96DRAFT_360543 [Gymnopus androsaceus JB14]|uniref:Uncharacterized protein n=1 Tax=Gymnopus androsaceus JB14 TaxID=1447944 RepID=A0A6A4I3Y7_9AGAR|nr:hypothetical protein BT96DRAFT_360543 [Gymnopus androsaceus JB14]
MPQCLFLYQMPRFISGRTTPVSSLPSPSSGSRAGVRPLPPPPSLPKAATNPISGPGPRSSSREPSKVRSRNNSNAGRGDAGLRPQLTFDPTSSSYVIRTAGELNSHIPTPPATASGVGFDKSRTTRVHTHNRSRSAQFKNFSSMVLPDVRDIRDAPLFNSSGRASTGGRWKGKQPIRSAPSSDTEDLPSGASKNRQSRSRPRLILHNPSDTSSKQSVRSAPSSDTEESPISSYSSSFPASATTKKAELISPLLLPPTGSIKDMLPQALAISTEGFSQPQPTKPALFPLKVIPTEPPIARQTSPPGPAQGVGFRMMSPPSLPSLSEDIGYADSGYVDDARVYIDDGYDGPGGLGAFSTSVDPDVDTDIGEIQFSTRPPSPFMSPSFTDLDMDARGRHVSRPTNSMRWKSADPRGADADIQRRGSAKSKDSHSSSHGGRSASQAVILSSLKAQMHPVPEVELGPVPINMDLEPEMVFSKNPTSFTPTHPVPGVLDTGDRIYVRGKWRSPSPLTPTGRNESLSNDAILQRFPVSAQFAPVRSRGFYEDW